MTVFPARRSVALKVATASSRAETLPMFVRSRPSRTQRIELGPNLIAAWNSAASMWALIRSLMCPERAGHWRPSGRRG